MSGLAVIIRNEMEFNVMKRFLDKYLYLDYVPQIEDVLTGVIIWYDDPDFLSIGSIGMVTYQQELGIRHVNFKDFFHNVAD